MALQQRPKGHWANVDLELPSSIFPIKVLDLMKMAGYSSNTAREHIKNGHVWKVYWPEWEQVKDLHEVVFIDFIGSDIDFPLSVQKGPYYDGSREIADKSTPWLTKPWGHFCEIHVRRVQKVVLEDSYGHD